MPLLRLSFLFLCLFFFFFNDTATTEIYTLSLHDALPICDHLSATLVFFLQPPEGHTLLHQEAGFLRSEEHTSELQSHHDLVCRLLLEKKKKKPVSRARHDPDLAGLLGARVSVVELSHLIY